MDGKGRTRVLLTGATGNLGRAVLAELRERDDRVTVLALARRTDRSRTVLERFADMENLEVAWGDLTDDASVAACVRRADVVLHAGGLVSPEADAHPELVQPVNVGGMRNIIDAVRSLPEPGAVAVVGIGSVAETGPRNPPRHWGRIGDPVQISRFDEYGLSKVIAERELVDSGLPKWTWLRLPGIVHPAMLGIRDPIMTHLTIGDVMEWVSAEDAARLLANLCDPDAAADVWGSVHNVGGGDGWRLTNWQFLNALGGAMGVRDIRRWYDRNWFATRNFHGHWYTDSDRLEELVPFRRDTFEGALHRATAAAPATVRNAGRVPAWIVKRFAMQRLARMPRGTMAAVRDRDEARIAAYFGSLDEWRAIGDWSTFEPPDPSRVPTMLDHGFDESKPAAGWTAGDYAGVAAHRGGRLLSSDPPTGDVSTRLTWACADGHEFRASARLVLAAGHWCPVCVADPVGYETQAHENAFLAQVIEDRSDTLTSSPT
ncbi:NAD(P)-dependent oxidoreductase [Agromyces sp. Marseille-P2726]|uniref:NAD-dependent epimerase/dehydratase family protein n=1 Tax=Agromyces sp. Marseille-P2726 TaxID=2709132 RepID=UPI001570FAB6|nr:NAD(P)-dependent oxidoreductase [Agromyces sp. Marseille-P2726]